MILKSLECEADHVVPLNQRVIGIRTLGVRIFAQHAVAQKRSHPVVVVGIEASEFGSYNKRRRCTFDPILAFDCHSLCNVD